MAEAGTLALCSAKQSLSPVLILTRLVVTSRNVKLDEFFWGCANYTALVQRLREEQTKKNK